ITGDNIGATAEPGEPNHGLGAGVFGNNEPWGASVWYRWVAPTNGAVAFNTIDANPNLFSLDTVLAAYEGTNLTTLIQLDTDDQGASFIQLNKSIVGFFGTAGTEYRIAVAGWIGLQGTFTLNWIQTPATNAPPPVLATNGIQFEVANFQV